MVHCISEFGKNQKYHLKLDTQYLAVSEKAVVILATCIYVI